MHRSGTSVTAAMLEELGVSLGGERDLMPEHREHREIVRIDDELLREAGGRWDDPPRRSALTGVLRSPPDRLRDRAIAVLEDLADRPSWGFKDPRASLTLPFWQGIVDLVPVLCVRDPVDVARSLERRDRFPVAKGVWLWANHLAASLDGPGRDPLVILYEDLLTDPDASVDRLIRHCRLEPPRDGAARAVGLVRDDREAAPRSATGAARRARDAYELIRTEGMGAAGAAVTILRELDDDLRPRFSESWQQRTDRMLEAITAAVPAGSTVAVIEDGSLQLPPEVRGRRVLRQDDLSGVEGPPADDAGAAARLSEIRDSGASHIAISWTSTWWLDHFPAFAEDVRSGGQPVLVDERVTLFALRP